MMYTFVWACIAILMAVNKCTASTTICTFQPGLPALLPHIVTGGGDELCNLEEGHTTATQDYYSSS